MNKIKLFISVCVAVVPVGMLYQSCGITKPRYIEYEKADGATTDGIDGTDGTEAAEPECPPASIFLAQMQPAIEKSCGAAGCHGTGSGGLTLEEGDNKATTNREALLGNVTDPVELFNKISRANGETHQGGDRSADLPKANIDAWWAGEAACK